MTYFIKSSFEEHKEQNLFIIFVFWHYLENLKYILPINSILLKIMYLIKGDKIS